MSFVSKYRPVIAGPHRAPHSSQVDSAPWPASRSIWFASTRLMCSRLWLATLAHVDGLGPPKPRLRIARSWLSCRTARAIIGSAAIRASNSSRPISSNSAPVMLRIVAVLAPPLMSPISPNAVPGPRSAITAPVSPGESATTSTDPHATMYSASAGSPARNTTSPAFTACFRMLGKIWSIASAGRWRNRSHFASRPISSFVCSCFRATAYSRNCVGSRTAAPFLSRNSEMVRYMVAPHANPPAMNPHAE